MLQEILPAGVFAFMIVFVRISTMLMMAPAYGESYIYPRVRLGIAVALTVLIAPAINPMLPPLPTGPARMFLLIVSEVMIGTLVVMAARLVITGLQVAGTLISMQSGLGSAMFFDPSQGSQTAVVSSMLMLTGLTLVFATDMHLLMLRGFVTSYQVFPPGIAPNLADFARFASDAVAHSFVLGMQIAAPFIVYGIVFNVGLALVNKLMPQFQVFFVGQSVQIVLALVLFNLTLATGMMWFVEHYGRAITALLAPK